VPVFVVIPPQLRGVVGLLFRGVCSVCVTLLVFDDELPALGNDVKFGTHGGFGSPCETRTRLMSLKGSCVTYTLTGQMLMQLSR
jgi:hypothetical protein